VDIDLYEVKAELVKRHEDEALDWIMAHGSPKAAYVVFRGIIRGGRESATFTAPPSIRPTRTIGFAPPL